MRLLPRDGEFFELFVAVAERNKEAARHQRQLFDAAPDRRTPHVEQIKRLEHEADQVTHEVVNGLDRTFITPLDREDIHELASNLDDVMDAPAIQPLLVDSPLHVSSPDTVPAWVVILCGAAMGLGTMMGG